MPKETKGLFSFYDISNIDFVAFLSTLVVFIGFIVGIFCMYSAYLVPGSIVCAGSLKACLYYLEEISVGVMSNRWIVEFWIWLCYSGFYAVLYEPMLFDNHLHNRSLCCNEILYTEMGFLQLPKTLLTDFYPFYEIYCLFQQAFPFTQYFVHFFFSFSCLERIQYTF